MPQVLNKKYDEIPPGAVYIGRGSKWGNPFVIGYDGDRAEVIEKYSINMPAELRAEAAIELRGKDLVCFCSPLPCHGNILLKIANT